MAGGIHAVNFADKVLNGIARSGAFPSSGVLYGKLHTNATSNGGPGAAGTANASALLTRAALTFSASSSGVLTLSNTPSWVMTATETIAWISLWDSSATSGGNFIISAALAASRSVNSGDTVNLTSFVWTLGPLAS